MAGDEAILVVGLMACFCSVVLSAGFGYTCTGGSFDPDDFDTDKCLTLFPEDDTGGGGGGGGGGTTNPSNYPTSNLYSECHGQFYNEATTTCFGDRIAGIRWVWLDNDTARTCRARTHKYGVVVSSSQTAHNMKYKFPDIVGNMANSMSFNNGPSGFLDNQNIKFYVTPLDVNDQKISDTAEYVLDTANSSETCSGHGTPVDFSQARLINTSTPAQETVPCSGDVYLPKTACQRAGVTLDNPSDASRCGDGFQTVELDTTHPSYKAATGGGQCQFSKTTPCSVPCASTVVRETKTQAMCDQEAYTYNQWVNAMGCVVDNFSHSSPPANQSDYTQMTGTCYPAGGEDGVTATLSMRVSSDGYSCVPVYNWNACGKQVCPVNCRGHWEAGAWGDWSGSHSCWGAANKTRYRTDRYQYDELKQGTGQACPHTEGDTRQAKECDCNTNCDDGCDCDDGVYIQNSLGEWVEV